jgi:hypothetical protein
MYRAKQPVTSLHGFADWNGTLTTDRLRPFFEQAGYPFTDWDYGFIGLLNVRLFNNKRARKLLEDVEPFSIAVAHSNGCDIVYRAMWMGAQFSQVVFINPALDEDAEFPTGDFKVHVWHSPHDYPAKFAGLFYKHSWGPMGNLGYVGNDPRVTNYDKESLRYGIKSYTHLDMFLPEKLAYFGPLIVSALEDD